MLAGWRIEPPVSVRRTAPRVPRRRLRPSRWKSFQRNSRPCAGSARYRMGPLDRDRPWQTRANSPCRLRRRRPCANVGQRRRPPDRAERPGEAETGGRPGSEDAYEILDGDRHAVQRPKSAPVVNCNSAARARRERSPHRRSGRYSSGVQPFDPVEDRLRHLDRRESAGTVEAT